MKREQQATGSEQGDASGGGNRGAPLSYSNQVEDVGAILRGDKPKGKPPEGKKDEGQGKPPGEAKGGDDGAGHQGNADDKDQGGEARRLAGEDGERRGDGGEGDAARGDSDAAGDKERITPAELAKALGVKDGEIFEQLAVDVDLTVDGKKTTEQVTLGDLRRGYIAAENLRRDRDSFDQEREAQSLEMMHGRRFFENMAERLAPYVPKDAIAILNAEKGQRLERERELLYAAVPEWKDPAKHAADRTAMIAYLKPWGFGAADVAAIDDHRIARFVRDMMNGAKRARDAEDRAKAARKQAGDGHPTSGRQHSSGGFAVRVRSIIDQGKAAKTSTGKAEAAGALLREHAKR